MGPSPYVAPAPLGFGLMAVWYRAGLMAAG